MVRNPSWKDLVMVSPSVSSSPCWDWVAWVWPSCLARPHVFLRAVPRIPCIEAGPVNLGVPYIAEDESGSGGKIESGESGTWVRRGDRRQLAKWKE